jgi:multiple sugar transport system substrate-binding protein
MKRSIATGLGIAAAVTMALTACGGGGTTAGSAPGASAGAPVTVSLAGWSLATTPEFKTLADAFHAANPNITVELKEYDAANYDTQMVADLAAHSAPDMYVQKTLKNFFTYQDGGQLMDVSDVASKLGKGINGLDAYKVDDAAYAIPYRQDSWYLYYNKDLFDAAKVAYPDGTWTWDDYAKNADLLAAGLKAAGSPAQATYQHSWQSVVQGFANAQSPKADILKGDFEYMKPYYKRAIAMQSAGDQPTYGTVTTNSLTYQAQFGKQKAAMMPMGSWYVATLIAQAATKNADTFNWGFAPIPQLDSSTVKKPVTFADPTGIGINPAIDKSKVAAAKAFLAFIGSEDASTKLASIGITPAYASDAVTTSYFGLKGVPGDDLSRFAFATHDTKPENPVSKDTAAIQNILLDMHSSIMSGSKSVDAGVAEAEARVKSEVLNK